MGHPRLICHTHNQNHEIRLAPLKINKNNYKIQISTYQPNIKR